VGWESGLAERKNSLAARPGLMTAKTGAFKAGALKTGSLYMLPPLGFFSLLL